jgi:hypothetical protein
MPLGLEYAELVDGVVEDAGGAAHQLVNGEMIPVFDYAYEAYIRLADGRLAHIGFSHLSFVEEPEPAKVA